MSDYDYAGYFGGIRETERLVIAKENINWLEKYVRPKHKVDVLLYLGCNVLRTAHLAREVVKVFETLGISFAAVGGPQFCCGIVHYGHGDQLASSRLSSATVEKFESFGAREIVMWCPSCNRHFEEVILKELKTSFSISHATRFLAERAEKIPFVKEIPYKVALHTHEGRAQQKEDADAAVTLLGAVPGIELVGTVADPQLDYHCNNIVIDKIGKDRFRGIRADLASEAVAAGADTLSTLYHSCHREWCELGDSRMKVKNYISLVSEALGIAEEDRYQEFIHNSDVDSIVEAASSNWRSHGLSEDAARKLARRHFVDSS